MRFRCLWTEELIGLNLAYFKNMCFKGSWIYFFSELSLTMWPSPNYDLVSANGMA